MGVESLEGGGSVAVAFNVGPESTGGDDDEVRALVEGLRKTDLKNLLFVEDPDGNLLELIARDGF